MTENDVTYAVRGAVFAVYNTLGPGLLERVYEEAMVYELKKRGLNVLSQVSVPIVYDGQVLDADLRLDLLVEDSVIVELKSVEELKDVHKKQLLTYLKLTNKHVGLLVNFNTANLASSMIRVVNDFTPYKLRDIERMDD